MRLPVMTTRRLMCAVAVLTLLAGAGIEAQTDRKDEDNEAGASDSRDRLRVAEKLVELSQLELKSMERMKVAVLANVESRREFRQVQHRMILSHKGVTGLQQIEDTKYLEAAATEEQVDQKEMMTCESNINVSEAQVAEAEATLGLCRAELRAKMVPGPASAAAWEQARVRLAEAQLRVVLARKSAADAEVNSAEAGVAAAQKKLAAAKAKCLSHKGNIRGLSLVEVG